MLKMAIIGCVLSLVAGCAQAPQPHVQTPPPSENRPGCHAGADAGGIAAGFFSFFTDDLNGCL